MTVPSRNNDWDQEFARGPAGSGPRHCPLPTARKHAPRSDLVESPCDRRFVGWSLDQPLDGALVIEALIRGSASGNWSRIEVMNWMVDALDWEVNQT